MDMNPCNKEAFGFISINPGDSTFLMREAPAVLVDFKNIRDMEALRELCRKEDRDRNLISLLYEKHNFTLAHWINSPHNVLSGRRRAETRG